MTDTPQKRMNILQFRLIKIRFGTEKCSRVLFWDTGKSTFLNYHHTMLRKVRAGALQMSVLWREINLLNYVHIQNIYTVFNDQTISKSDI